MAIIRIDKAQATYAGNIVSFEAPANMTNGLVFNLDGLKTGEREVYEIEKPATASLETAEVLIHATPEVVYESEKVSLEDFELKKDKVGRGFHMTAGDIFTVTDDLITGDPAVGEYVVAANDSWKLAASATMTDNRFVGEIIEKTTLGFEHKDAWTFRVVRA